jgi:aconitate hydratase
VTDAIQLADGGEFRFEPPAGVELPGGGFDRGAEGYLAPPEDGSGVELSVAPDSERLQLLQPFAAWDGMDLEGLPVLLKAAGKCTTDHISAAGPWLRYRGHLENISGNLYMSAQNAFAEGPGTGTDVMTGEQGIKLPDLAKRYAEMLVEWVVIGDENYGEGSSREHAAMEPRHRGCRAVIARSFARIAETNLKRQGILPLLFADGADYDLIRETDRVAVRGLDALAPDSRIDVVLTHEDGTEDVFAATHTLSEAQVEWFKAGSALNAMRARLGT